MFGALGAVLNLGVGASIDVILPLLSALGLLISVASNREVVGGVVCAILSVTGAILPGLEGAVVGLIGGVVGVVLQLNVSLVISILGL